MGTAWATTDPAPESVPAPDLRGPALTLWVENDAVFHTDRHYTHGSRISFLDREVPADAEHPVAVAASWMPPFGLEPVAARWGLELGQSLYTPADLRNPLLQPNDRPYAAWLYGSVTLQTRGHACFGVPAMDSWSMDFGIVGPGALGEELQDLIHQVDAAGWAHQLHNEPAVDLAWSRFARFSASLAERWSVQALPYGGLRAGTVHVHAVAGTQFRAGYAIPDDFGRHTLDDAAPETGGRPASRQTPFHTYFLVALEGRAVAWNMLLDGNLWHASHSVDKEPWVGDVRTGLVVGWRAIELAYIHVFRTREFHGQSEVDSFGSLALSYRW